MKNPCGGSSTACYTKPGTTPCLPRTARRLSDPSLKILYLTGYSDRLFKDKVTLWEDEAFLDKPCTVKSLMEAVSLLLSGSVDPGAGRAGTAGGAGE